MSNTGIKKYYIGLLALMVIGVGILVYTLSQSASAKIDDKTDKAVEAISDKLSSYSVNSGSAPASLQAAGVKDVPSTVTYTKLSDLKYKICFDYKNASNGFDASWGSLLGGAVTGSDSAYNVPGNSDYFNSYVEFSHKKGQNCQTVTFSLGSSINYGGSSNSAASACENLPQGLIGGDLTVSRVDTASKTIYFDATNQYVYDNSGTAVPTIGSKLYSDNTIFCNGKDLSLTSASVIKGGDQITVYLKSASDNTLSQVNTTYLFQ